MWVFKSGATVHASGPFSADHTATVASMAIAGLGIARITSVVAAPLVAQGKLVEVLSYGDAERFLADRDHAGAPDADAALIEQPALTH